MLIAVVPLLYLLFATPSELGNNTTPWYEDLNNKGMTFV